MLRRVRVLPLIVAGLMLALAGCGSSSSTSTTSSTTAAAEAPTATTAAAQATTTTAAAPAGGSGKALELAANPEGQLKYDKTALSAEKAGHISIAFTNMSPLGHNLTVATASGAVVGATPTIQGQTQTLSLTLKPGTYKFYCSVPGHRMAGMEGTLTVK
jgi:uncharacterized cupredoxin-like copper-binding protein